MSKKKGKKNNKIKSSSNNKATSKKKVNIKNKSTSKKKVNSKNISVSKTLKNNKLKISDNNKKKKSNSNNNSKAKNVSIKDTKEEKNIELEKINSEEKINLIDIDNNIEISENENLKIQNDKVLVNTNYLDNEKVESANDKNVENDKFIKEVVTIEKNINNNRKKIIIILIVIILFLTLVIFLIIPKINLKGDSYIEINYGEEYTDEGAYATLLNSDISRKIKISGEVDSKTVGEYKIEYEIKWLFLNIKKTRKINVVDKVPPTIKLIGDEKIEVCPGKEYVDLGFEAYDEYDGDLTSKVSIDVLDDKVIYKVSDSSNNDVEIVRYIEKIDNVAPELNLNGSETVYVQTGSNYNEPGFNATDNCMDNLNDSVKVSGDVNTNVPGNYVLTYTVSDEGGNTTTKTRNVYVYNVNTLNSGTINPGVIYLTFDDGPNGSTTGEILNILAEEGVKATFFVTTNGPDYLIQREFNEGHTVALHTASHDYSYIYSNVSNYFSDLESVQRRVVNLTGVRSNIIRFPGGSSNTVSCSYDGGSRIMTVLTNEVVNRGYKYFDWNVDANDAGACVSVADKKSCVYNNVVNGLSKNRPNVVLMHDIKYYTKDALRDIIRYGKNNGYIFARLDNSVQAVHFRVNN